MTMHYHDEYEKRRIEGLLQEGKAISLPAGGPITKGPVLCLDIDGVVSPCAQDRRFNINAYPEGFINVEGAISYPVQVHPALPRWLAALEEHFTTCLWVTTWRYRSRWLMDALELAGPAGWPYILPIDTPHFPGDHIDFYKLEARHAPGWTRPCRLRWSTTTWAAGTVAVDAAPARKTWTRSSPGPARRCCSPPMNISA